MSESVAILVVGYDPYKDVWDDYFTLLNKYWQDRPKTYLATNTLVPKYKDVTVIPSRVEAEWSEKVQNALKQIKEEYVVLLLEDFFTTRKVNTKRFMDLVKLIEEKNIDYCKLLNQSRIRGKTFEGQKFLHIIDREDKYGISLQPSIWKSQFLLDLVGNGNYNAWIFEYNQIENCYQNKERINCIADDRNVLEITHMVVQSSYLNSALRVFKKQGFNVNTAHIKPMSKKKEIKYRAKQFFSEYTPRSMVPFARKIGRLFKMEYVSDKQIKVSK